VNDEMFLKCENSKSGSFPNTHGWQQHAVGKHRMKRISNFRLENGTTKAFFPLSKDTRKGQRLFLENG
jgi:hypothetical protein